MVRSNVVTIRVKPKVEKRGVRVTSVELSAEKYEIVVGEEVVFTLTVGLEAEAPAPLTWSGGVFVDGNRIMTVNVVFPRGSRVASTRFRIQFTKPGEYNVYVEGGDYAK